MNKEKYKKVRLPRPEGDWDDVMIRYIAVARAACQLHAEYPNLIIDKIGLQWATNPEDDVLCPDCIVHFWTEPQQD